MFLVLYNKGKLDLVLSKIFDTFLSKLLKYVKLVHVVHHEWQIGSGELGGAAHGGAVIGRWCGRQKNDNGKAAHGGATMGQKFGS